MERYRELLSALQAQGLTGFMRDPRGLVAMGAIALLIVYGLSVGKTRALLSLLAIYVAYTLALLFPFIDAVALRVPEPLRPFVTAGLFVALFIAVFLILSLTLRKSRVAMGEISVIAVVIISIAQVGLLTAMLASLVPPETVTRYAGGIGRILTGPYALWAWAAGSLMVLPFVRARGRHS